MTTLLIKDWRLNAPVTLCLILIYAIMPFLIFASRAADEGARLALRGDNLIAIFMISAFAGLGVSLLIVPAFGGIAFARERRDRSADFLASHAIPRGQIVASKVVVALLLCALPWLFSGIYMLAARYVAGPGTGWVGSGPSADGNAEALGWILLLELMLFGFAWLLSSMVRSETMGAAGSILVTVLLSIVYVVYRIRLERTGTTFEAEAGANHVAFIVLLSLGIGGFIAGTIIALRRVSP